MSQAACWILVLFPVMYLPLLETGAQWTIDVTPCAVLAFYQSTFVSHTLFYGSLLPHGPPGVARAWLPHHGLYHGLQRNPSFGTFSAFCLSFCTGLGVFLSHGLTPLFSGNNNFCAITSSSIPFPRGVATITGMAQLCQQWICLGPCWWWLFQTWGTLTEASSVLLYLPLPLCYQNPAMQTQYSISKEWVI